MRLASAAVAVATAASRIASADARRPDQEAAEDSGERASSVGLWAAHRRNRSRRCPLLTLCGPRRSALAMRSSDSVGSLGLGLGSSLSASSGAVLGRGRSIISGAGSPERLFVDATSACSPVVLAALTAARSSARIVAVCRARRSPLRSVHIRARVVYPGPTTTPLNAAGPAATMRRCTPEPTPVALVTEATASASRGRRLSARWHAGVRHLRTWRSRRAPARGPSRRHPRPVRPHVTECRSPGVCCDVLDD